MLQSPGYIRIPPEDLEAERTGFKEPIFTNRLAAGLLRLNPWLSETNLARAVKAVNQFSSTSLTYGIALEQDRGDRRKSHTVRFLNFDKPKRNEWISTRQYKVPGAKKHVIPDIVVLVNGLALAVIEYKSPTIGDTWKTGAVRQLHRYETSPTRLPPGWPFTRHGDFRGSDSNQTRTKPERLQPPVPRSLCRTVLRMSGATNRTRHRCRSGQSDRRPSRSR